MPTPKEKNEIEKEFDATSIRRRELEAENQKLNTTAENLKVIAQLEEANKKLAEQNKGGVK